MGSVEEICDDIALINHSKVVLDGSVLDVRSHYRTGLYEIIAGGGLQSSGCFEVLSTSPSHGCCKYLVRKNDKECSNSLLLGELAKQVEIYSFAEQTPSMNDIFLKVVGGQDLEITDYGK